MRIFQIVLLMAGLLLMAGCQKAKKKRALELSGTVTAPAGEAPVFVGVIRSNLAAGPDELAGMVVALGAADRHSGRYKLDLEGRDLSPGDKVMVFAFTDQDFDGNMPNPDAGDKIGLYHGAGVQTIDYVLQAGENPGIDIQINRVIYDYQKRLSGVLQGDWTGPVLLFAYAGEPAGLTADAFDFDAIIGFSSVQKTKAQAVWNMDILPWGFPLPIPSVYVFAVLDGNGNGLPDPGESISWHSLGDEFAPRSFSLEEGPDRTVHLNLDNNTVVPEPGTLPLAVSGDLSLSSEPDPGESVYVMVLQTDDPASLIDNPLPAVRAWQKLKPGEQQFRIDLQNTAVRPGDAVMVSAFVDRDGGQGLPALTPGDTVGFWLDAGQFTQNLTLAAGENTTGVIRVDRDFYDWNRSLSGRIVSAYTGDCLVVAYTGEISSLNPADLDPDGVLAFTRFEKPTTESMPWQMQLLPFGNTLPLEKVTVFVLFDANGNGRPDAGEEAGFAMTGGLPLVLTVDHKDPSGIELAPTMTIPAPSSGQGMTLEGGWQADGGTGPAFVVVVDAAEPADLQDFSKLRFRALQKLPEGADRYTLDLAGSGLSPGDEVMVMVMRDGDYNGVFPSPGPGDRVGYYQDRNALTFEVPLGEGPTVLDQPVLVNKAFYDHQASLEFRIRTHPALGPDLGRGDEIVVFAVQADGVDLQNMAAFDMDYVVALQKISLTGDGDEYFRVPLLPVLLTQIVADPFAIESLYVIGLLDTNRNGLPDAGEHLGFYDRSAVLPLPLLTNVTDGVNRLDRAIRFSGLKFERE